ncbi:MAG: hypothetical protein E6K70_22415 [Planctomycetota bacterium]|nr:MAG: hypothetical protein E6K70_22415 [Planctomycetota bacterium]
MGRRLLPGKGLRVPAAVATVLLSLGITLLCRPASPIQEPARSAEPTQAPVARTIYLVGDLPEEDLMMVTAAVAVGDHPGVLLLNSPKSKPFLKTFLAAFRPETIVPIGSFPHGVPELEERSKVDPAKVLDSKRSLPNSVWKTFCARAERLVVCPPSPRALMLQCTCLAGAMRAPLFVLRDEQSDGAALRRQLAEWGTREVLAVGDAAKTCRDLPEVHVTELKTEQAAAEASWEHQARKGPIQSLVIANAADGAKDRGKLSALAPWFAIQHRAALLLTNQAGTNVAEVVQAALKNPVLAQADALILAADLQAVPMDRRPNPVPGKDTWIFMEPLTPTGAEPFTFATGRLFHDDLGVLTLLVARQQLLTEAGAGKPRKALMVSNPGGGLALLETFWRNTAMDLRNCGYETTALFEKDANPNLVRRLMPEQDIFLWEGHYKTMVEEYGLPAWTEPLQPSLIFLQSCLTLNETEALPLLQRGAVAIVGSPTRNYSGSGGAFTLAFFDALLYERQSLGGALRQAKNFLLAYSLLKEKRLKTNARLGGANLRSAWAFSLWGDPTLKLPLPAAAPGARPPARHRVHGNRITLTIPEATYPKVSVEQYQAQMWPNTRLAGLLEPDREEDQRRLVPFLFAEVVLPEALAGKTPRLTTPLSSRRWVFCWDERRRSGYLLVIPRAREEREVRFQVNWDG